MNIAGVGKLMCRSLGINNEVGAGAKMQLLSRLKAKSIAHGRLSCYAQKAYLPR